MVEKLLVPIDDSEQSTDALGLALAEYPDASITVLHVVDPVEYSWAYDEYSWGYTDEMMENAMEAGERLVEEARSVAADAGRDVATAIEQGPPARVIVDYAEEHGMDLIVMGSHGRSGLARILLGSVAEAVVRRAPIPVLVVR